MKCSDCDMGLICRELSALRIQMRSLTNALKKERKVGCYRTNSIKDLKRAYDWVDGKSTSHNDKKANKEK